MSLMPRWIPIARLVLGPKTWWTDGAVISMQVSIRGMATDAI